MGSDYENLEASEVDHRQNKRGQYSTTFRSIALATLVFLAILAVYRQILTSSSVITGESPCWQGDCTPKYEEHPEKPFHPLRRYDLYYNQVAAWPSTGGVWIKRASAVELQALGVDRFNNTERSTDPASEDEFCDRLRTFGASFYALPPQWPEGVSWCEDLDFCVEPEIRVNVEIGFPAGGGAWVLDMTPGFDYYGDRFVGLSNALNMEERCQVIKSLGGKFCDDIESCIREASKRKNEQHVVE